MSHLLTLHRYRILLYVVERWTTLMKQVSKNEDYISTKGNQMQLRFPKNLTSIIHCVVHHTYITRLRTPIKVDCTCTIILRLLFFSCNCFTFYFLPQIDLWIPNRIIFSSTWFVIKIIFMTNKNWSTEISTKEMDVI